MNKSVRRLLCLLLSTITVGSFAVSCGGSGGGNGSSSSSIPGGSVGGSESESSEDTSDSSSEEIVDPNSLSETRPIVFSTEPLDGNFNPFFATSATDVEILSMTQISMLGVDADGNVACGQDQPTVVDSYTITTDPENKYTDYSFVIKNGIKFSNGTALTIDDVLFNLYVYLDPAYMGSATIYSTDIVGLAAYQAQDAGLLENDAGFDIGALNKTFYNEADARIQRIIDSLDKDSGYTPSEAEQAEIDEDIARLKVLFQEEVISDWNNNAGTQTSYEQEYTLKEDWEIYFFVEGLGKYVYYSTENGKQPLKDAYGKYITTLTKPGAPLEIDDNGTPDDVSDDIVLKEYDGTYQGQTHYASHIVEEIESAAADEELIAAKMETADVDRELAIQLVIQDKAIEMVYDAYTVDTYVEQILLWWASGDNLREELMAKARAEYYAEQLASGMKVTDIRGITTGKTADGKTTYLISASTVLTPKQFGTLVSPLRPNIIIRRQMRLKTRSLALSGATPISLVKKV